MTTKGETRIPIGEDFYLTLSTFQAESKIHIRKFISSPALYNPAQTYLTPTKQGLTMSTKQCQALKLALPTIMPMVFSNNITMLPQQFAYWENKCIPLGDDLYLSPSCWDGELKIHIRKFIPMKLLNWNFELTNTLAYDPEKLQPTKTGVCLTTHQTIKLHGGLDIIDTLLMSPPQAPSTLPGLGDITHLQDFIENLEEPQSQQQQQQQQQIQQHISTVDALIKQERSLLIDQEDTSPDSGIEGCSSSFSAEDSPIQVDQQRSLYLHPNHKAISRRRMPKSLKNNLLYNPAFANCKEDVAYHPYSELE